MWWYVCGGDDDDGDGDDVMTDDDVNKRRCWAYSGSVYVTNGERTGEHEGCMLQVWREGPH